MMFDTEGLCIMIFKFCKLHVVYLGYTKQEPAYFGFMGRPELQYTEYTKICSKQNVLSQFRFFADMARE